MKGTSLSHFNQVRALSRANIFIGGDAGIVHAMGKIFGLRIRLIAKMCPDGVSAWGILEGDQSGNQDRIWYTNLTEPYSKGEYIQLDLD